MSTPMPVYSWRCMACIHHDVNPHFPGSCPPSPGFFTLAPHILVPMACGGKHGDVCFLPIWMASCTASNNPYAFFPAQEAMPPALMPPLARAITSSTFAAPPRDIFKACGQTGIAPSFMPRSYLVLHFGEFPCPLAPCLQPHHIFF